MPADGSGTDLKHGGSSLPDLTNFKIEPNPSANNFVHMSGGTCSTIKVEEPDQGSPYSSVRNSDITPCTRNPNPKYENGF